MSYPEQILKNFNISDKKLRKLLKVFEADLEAGLKAETRESADLKSLPTYVASTPDGTEHGNYIALDLGGTNFRILLVKINAGEKPSITMESQVYFMSQDKMTGPGVELFDSIAEDLYDFFSHRNLTNEISTLPIGFTFSFPTLSLGFKQTILLEWTKGYNCSGVVGNDIGQMLNDAIQRKFGEEAAYGRELPTIVNDTVGTLVAAGYHDHQVSMGLIIGTGTNMCYMEDQNNIEFIPDDKKMPGCSEMCLNVEWATFGDVSGALSEFQTEFDVIVDRESCHIGNHLFEKMIGGMYLGELARQIIIKLHEDGIMFENISQESLLRHKGLSTAFISEMTEPNMSLDSVGKYLEGLGLTATKEECSYVVQLSIALSVRAAKLCAVGVVAVGNRVIAHRNTRRVVVGVDGSVYKKHPTFSNMLKAYVKELAAPRNNKKGEDENVEFEFQISNDGSGKGAALVAAVDARYAKTSSKRAELASC